MATWDSRVAVAANAQQEPQCPWSFIVDTTPCSRQSTCFGSCEAGRRVGRARVACNLWGDDSWKKAWVLEYPKLDAFSSSVIAEKWLIPRLNDEVLLLCCSTLKSSASKMALRVSYSEAYFEVKWNLERKSSNERAFADAVSMIGYYAEGQGKMLANEGAGGG